MLHGISTPADAAMDTILPARFGFRADAADSQSLRLTFLDRRALRLNHISQQVRQEVVLAFPLGCAD